MFAASFNLLNIHSYEQAHDKWASITPIRGRSVDVRPLFRRSNDNAIVYKNDRDQSVRFRLYSTDVVTFNTDGTVDLEPYASASTNRFAWAVLRGHTVRTHWADRHHPCPDHVTEIGGKFYHTPDYVTVQWDKDAAGWTYVAGAVPFEVPTLDMSKTREARKDSRYDEFALWIKTQLRLGIDPRMGDTWRTAPYDWSTREVSQYLAVGPEGWAEMTRRMSRRTHVNADLEALRMAVYKWAGYCIDETEVPYFNSFSEMAAAFNKMRKYG